MECPTAGQALTLFVLFCLLILNALVIPGPEFLVVGVLLMLMVAVAWTVEADDS